MRALFHDYWQPIAVAVITTLLALQIPRKVLFFHPRMSQGKEARFSASFVAYDAQAIQKVRMAWQLRSRATMGAGFDSRSAVFEGDPLPEPDVLGVESLLTRTSVGSTTISVRQPSLLPSSLALTPKGRFTLTPAVKPAMPDDLVPSADQLAAPETIELPLLDFNPKGMIP